MYFVFYVWVIVDPKLKSALKTKDKIINVNVISLVTLPFILSQQKRSKTTKTVVGLECVLLGKCCIFIMLI